jgi:hypothetical protein
VTSSRPHRLFSLLRGSKGRRLALFLVGTLLVCHGSSEFYTFAPLLRPTHQTFEFPSFADETSVGHEHPSRHLMGAEYFAVLLTAFLELVLGLLLKGARTWSRISAFRPFERSLPPFVSKPPRGPTRHPILQVFRL